MIFCIFGNQNEDLGDFEFPLNFKPLLFVFFFANFWCFFQYILSLLKNLLGSFSFFSLFRTFLGIILPDISGKSKEEEWEMEEIHEAWAFVGCFGRCFFLGRG